MKEVDRILERKFGFTHENLDFEWYIHVYDVENPSSRDAPHAVEAFEEHFDILGWEEWEIEERLAF